MMMALLEKLQPITETIVIRKNIILPMLSNEGTTKRLTATLQRMSSQLKVHSD